MKFKKKAKKGLGPDMCCEICNNCNEVSEGNYECLGKQVIGMYMPSEDYYHCKGQQFRERRG